MICGRCGSLKVQRPSGLACRNCRAQAARKSYAKHRELVCQRRREWRKQNPEAAKAIDVVDRSRPGRAERKREREKQRWQRMTTEQMEAKRTRDKAYHSANRGTLCDKKKLRARKVFFRTRARDIRRRYGTEISAMELWSMWKRQRGRCAITGRSLRPLIGREVQIDHIVPRVLGGPTAVSNLRWVCRSANTAKGKLTDGEFLNLCSEVLLRNPIVLSLAGQSPC